MAEDEWACPSCTLINPPSSVCCTACGTDFPAPGRPPAQPERRTRSISRVEPSGLSSRKTHPCEAQSYLQSRTVCGRLHMQRESQGTDGMCWAFAGAWTRALGFLGAVAGSAAGALLSSTRRGTRPSEHAIWMACGAAMGIEGKLRPNSFLCIAAQPMCAASSMTCSISAAVAISARSSALLSTLSRVSVFVRIVAVGVPACYAAMLRVLSYSSGAALSLGRRYLIALTVPHAS